MEKLAQRFANSLATERGPQSKSHWLMVGLFGLLLYVPLWGQLVVLLGLALVMGIVQGPGLLLWGTLTAFLIAWFPPLALVFTIITMVVALLRLRTDATLFAVSSIYYGLPLILGTWRAFHPIATWLILLIVAAGMFLAHFALLRLPSRQFCWYLLERPFVIVTLFLPKRLKARWRKPPVTNYSKRAPRRRTKHY